jgi:hypothetical protein
MLEQNSPNPFNPSTEIRFILRKEGAVKLLVFNASGQVVATLIDGNVSAGPHSVRFDARGFASGVYFYRMTAGGVTTARKMTLLK